MRLKQGRDHSVKRYHPWVFSGAIQSISGEVKDGEWVEVADANGKVLGFGHYQKGTITVRMISFGAIPPGDSVYRAKIKSAFTQRINSRVLNEFTNAYRLVHGEGDGLPGLIVDVYHNVTRSLAMKFQQSITNHFLKNHKVNIYWAWQLCHI